MELNAEMHVCLRCWETIECSAWNKTFIPYPLRWKEYRRGVEKSVRAGRQGGVLWDAVSWAWPITVLMASQQLWLPTTFGLHKTGPAHSHSWMEEELIESYPFLLSYWLLMDSGKGTIIVFSYVSTEEPTRSRPWPHRWSWLNSVGLKNKTTNETLTTITKPKESWMWKRDS